MNTTKPDFRLSKSKIAAFEHCPKRLWLQIHRCEEGRFDEATLNRFQFGHDVGARARMGVPNGVLVETGMDMAAALQRTSELLSTYPRQPIFEATFQHANVLVRVDILMPLAGGGWHAIEVKAATRTRASHIADLATQVWVMRGCGVPIDQATIRRLRGPLTWRNRNAATVKFCDDDVTAAIERLVRTRSAVVLVATSTAQADMPKIEPGTHCHQPFTCEFQAFCECAINPNSRIARHFRQH